MPTVAASTAKRSLRRSIARWRDHFPFEASSAPSVSLTRSCSLLMVGAWLESAEASLRNSSSSAAASRAAAAEAAADERAAAALASAAAAFASAASSAAAGSGARESAPSSTSVNAVSAALAREVSASISSWYFFRSGVTVTGCCCRLQQHRELLLLCFKFCLHSRVADARSWRRERARSAAAEASAACFSSRDLRVAMSRAGCTFGVEYVHACVREKKRAREEDEDG